MVVRLLKRIYSCILKLNTKRLSLDISGAKIPDIPSSSPTNKNENETKNKSETKHQISRKIMTNLKRITVAVSKVNKLSFSIKSATSHPSYRVSLVTPGRPALGPFQSPSPISLSFSLSLGIDIFNALSTTIKAPLSSVKRT